MTLDVPSQHPVDQLMRDLVDTDRGVTLERIEQVVRRMVEAPFDRGSVRVPRSERGIAYHGSQLRAREDSLFLHLDRRVLIDRRWAAGTTADVYLDDPREAMRAADMRLAVDARRGDYQATCLGTDDPGSG